MQRSQQVGVVVGIIGVGVLGSLPFARFTPPAEMEPSAQAQPGQVDVGVALHLPGENGPSPAIGLHDQELSRERDALQPAPVISRSRLEENGLPPDLPAFYPSSQPLVPQREAPRQLQPAIAPPAGEMRLDQPRVRVRLDEGTATVEPTPPRVRKHRIVDGDTLARLALRYWGNAELADALFACNRDVLDAPDPLPLGVMLRIPLQPELPTPAAVAPAPVSAPAAAVVRQPELRSPEQPSETTEQLAPIPAGAFRQP